MAGEKKYPTEVIPPPGEQADSNTPLRLLWTNGSREYDIYLDSRQSPGDDVVLVLWEELHDADIDDKASSYRRWAVIDRGEGRLNIIPPNDEARHEHVAAVVTRLLISY